MDKGTLRKELITKRSNMEDMVKSIYDLHILNTIINNEVYKKASNIFIYVSFGNEVETKEIIKYSLSIGKNIYIPKTNKENKTMEAIKIESLDDLVADKCGILEPKNSEEDKLGEKFDLIILPGLVFDKYGNRIGYGAGYYDRYIKKLSNNPYKIALAYDFQVIDFIEGESHDIKVDAIVTNNKYIEVEK